jgi:hypothetical protein
MYHYKHKNQAATTLRNSCCGRHTEDRAASEKRLCVVYFVFVEKKEICIIIAKTLVALADLKRVLQGSNK